MWTVKKLREVVAIRGESVPASPQIGKALLAFERWKGRTEETYSRDEAKRQLDSLLDKLDSMEWPTASPKEYAGLKQLRAYAQERAREHYAKEAQEPGPVLAKDADELERDEERSR